MDDREAVTYLQAVVGLFPDFVFTETWLTIARTRGAGLVKAYNEINR